MYFSGKITNSFFTFLNNCDSDTSCFFDMTELEIDSLKDPHSWMEASQVEALLYNVKRAYQDQFIDKDLVTTVGHNSTNLNCWGGLEKFLKMFRRPNEIHDKLDIFFSYFISPTFKIHSQEEAENHYSFKTNFDGEEYPTVRDYFCSILEAFPVFLSGDNEDITEAQWSGEEVKIYYGEEKNLLFPLKDFQKTTSKFLDKNILRKQISYFEKNLLEVKKTGSVDSIDKSLKIIHDIKKGLED